MQGAVGSVLAISRAVIQRHRDGNCRENTQTLTASQFQEREQPFSSSKLRFTNYLCRKSWHGGAVPLGSPAHGIYWHRSMTAPRAPKEGPRLRNPRGFHGITEGFGLEGTLNLVLPLEQLLQAPEMALAVCACPLFMSVCLSVCIRETSLPEHPGAALASVTPELHPPRSPSQTSSPPWLIPGFPSQSLRCPSL